MFAVGGWAFLASSYKIFAGNPFPLMLIRSLDPEPRYQTVDIEDGVVKEGPIELEVIGTKTSLHHLALEPLSDI